MMQKFLIFIHRVKYSSLARRFLDGAAWSVFGSVLSSGMTLVMMMMVARLLGKETYGQFVIVQSTLSMVGVFAGFGIGAAATRYVAEYKIINTIKLGHILILAERAILGFGLLVSAILVLTAGWMATNVLNAELLGFPLAIAACSVFFSALDGYQKSILIGFESMRAFAITTVTGVALGFPVMLVAVKFFGLNGGATAILINSLLQATVSRYQMMKELKKYKIKPNPENCLNELPILWHFAFPALLSGALFGPAHWVVQALLANTDNGYNELAIMGIAMQWFNIIMFVPATAGRVVMPILTEHISKNDHNNSQKILLCAMGANAIVALPMAAIIGIFSSNIMSIYGKSFEQYGTPLLIGVLIAALVSIILPVGHLLAALSRMWIGALMNAGWALLYIGVAYMLLSKGAIGVMLALGVAYIFHAAWTLLYARSHVNSLILELQSNKSVE